MSYRISQTVSDGQRSFDVTTVGPPEVDRAAIVRRAIEILKDIPQTGEFVWSEELSAELAKLRDLSGNQLPCQHHWKTRGGFGDDLYDQCTKCAVCRR